MAENFDNVKEQEDDGTLACLHLEDDEEDGYFKCPQTNQHSMVNKTFCVVAYHDDVPTRWTRNEKGEPAKSSKMVVKIKPKMDSPESDALKFFTGSKGIHKIIGKYKGKPLYCLKIDVTKFYPSVNHDILKAIIRKKIKDKDLLWLLDEIIDSTDGLPIGNYLSQYFANLYLCYFMHFVNETLKVDSCEYADDIVFFSESKERLHYVLEQVQQYMTERLRLTLKPNYQIFPVSASRYDRHGRCLDYVGYQFFREQTLMRKSIKVNFCRRVAILNKTCNVLSEYKQAISAWLGWAKYSHSKHLLKVVLKNEFYNDISKYTRCA